MQYSVESHPTTQPFLNLPTVNDYSLPPTTAPAMPNFPTVYDYSLPPPTAPAMTNFPTVYDYSLPTPSARPSHAQPPYSLWPLLHNTIVY